MRWVLRILLLLVALPLLLVGAVLVGVNTAPGRGALERLAGSFVPGLAIEGLEGPLPGRLRVARLTMADAQGPWLELEQADIRLDLLALLGREVRVTAIEAQRLAVLRAPPPGAEPPPPPEPGAPLLPSLPSLPVTVRLETLAVARIELGQPLLGMPAALSLKGDAALTGAGLAAQFAIERLDAPATVALSLGLAPGDRLQARVALNEPGGLISGMLGQGAQPTTATLTLDGPASGAELALEVAIGGEIALRAEGTVRAASDGAVGAALRGETRAAPLIPAPYAPLGTPVAWSVDAEMDAAQRLTLRSLTAEAPAGNLALSGSADLAAKTMDMALRLTLAASQGFGAVVPPQAAWETVQAEATARGPFAAPRIALQAHVARFASNLPQAVAALGETPRLTLDASLPDRIHALRLTGAGTELTASGAIGETLDFVANLRVQDLALFAPGAKGSVTAEARLTGARGDPNLDLTVRGERISGAGREIERPEIIAHVATPLSAPRADIRATGRFSGLALDANIQGRPEGERMRLEAARIAFGPARLEARGAIDTKAAIFEGDVRLDVPDLAPFSALAGMPLGGRVGFQARLWPENGLQGLDARLETPGLRAGTTAADGRLTAKGTPAALEAELQARAAGVALATRARLATEGATRRVEIAELSARRGSEQIRLAAPARIALRENGAIEIGATTIATGRGGSLRAEGRWGPAQADLRVTVTALPIGAITAIAAPDQRAEGSIAADLRVTGPVAAPEARGTVTASNLRSLADWARGMPAVTIRAEGAGSPTRAELRAEAIAGNAVRLTATARLPNGFAGNAPVNATIDGNADIAVLSAPFLAAGAQRATGRVTMALRAEGSMAAPRLGGRVTLAGASFRDLAQGLTLTDIAGTVTGNGTRLVIERITAKTPGGGDIAVAGNLDVAAPGMPAEITVTARNARPIQSELLSEVLDADLRFAGQVAGESRLSGTVRIQRADIRIPEKLPRSVRTLPNVHERGRRPEGTPPLAPPRPAGPARENPIALALEIQAARQIFVRGRGIDAELGGRLTIGGTAGAPVPAGGFEMRRGIIEIFDRRLDFSRGRVSFDAGTLTPTLDMEATSRAREVTITVKVEGPANDPKLSFSSQPELPQDEILARLLFDRTARDLSPFQIAQLAEAAAGAAGLNTGGGTGGFLARIRRNLGLDRLAVGSGDGDDSRTRGSNNNSATLEAGRYIAPGVYLGVQQGTTGGGPRVGVQVDVAPRLRLEAQTGGNTQAGDRVGLSYEFEY